MLSRCSTKRAACSRTGARRRTSLASQAAKQGGAGCHASVTRACVDRAALARAAASLAAVAAAAAASAAQRDAWLLL